MVIDAELRVARGAMLCEIARYAFGPFHGDDRAKLCSGDHIAGDDGVACFGSNGCCDPYGGVADDVAAHSHITQVRTPAGPYSDLRGVLDHVPGYGGFRLDADADPGILGSGARSLDSDVAGSVCIEGRN